MAGKPLPHIRKPSSAAAASFVESDASPAPLELVRPPVPTSTTKKKSTGEAKAPRRRVSVYLTVATAKQLRLQSVNQDRDMSDIVEDLLAKHLR
jgi:hypothetical protein